MNMKKKSEEHKRKLSESNIGKHDHHGSNNPMFGRHQSEEVKEKNRLAHLDKHASEETRKKMSEQRRGIRQSPSHVKKRIRYDEFNGSWKGDKVGHDALHAWVKKRLPKPNLCENCELVPPFDLANISGEYKRDLDDWWYLCRKCHMESDGRMDNLHRPEIHRR